ncbi:MAG: type I-C CRISPR-associated protein Cas8c/Csd1 [Magnetococcales bacterium]|nr:type I-C CRISPR-associated protein Cas8c/Csd1 [Magnetococcales bacterium]
MILQALYGYYQRKSRGDQPELPAYGYSVEKISYALVIDARGQVVGEPLDLRMPDARGRLVPRPLPVPHPGGKRTSGIEPFFCWDKTAYLLGAEVEGKRLADCLTASREQHRAVLETVEGAAAQALRAYFDLWRPERVQEWPQWQEISGSNLVFKLDGTPGYLHDDPAIRTAWETYLARGEEDVIGQCLLTGQPDALARIHPDIKGVKGGQTSGTAIISFNKSAFESYGKAQSFNAPVGKGAARGYAAALNHLLRSESRNKVQIGDAATLFWAERDSPAEDLLPLLWSPPLPAKPASGSRPAAASQVEDDPATRQRLHSLLSVLARGGAWSGLEPDWDPQVRIFVLGLSPNAARLAVRYWITDPLDALLRRLGDHYRDIAIQRAFPETEPEFPPLWLLLRQTAAEGKADNIPPNLAGGVMRAILTGSPYPHSLLMALITRIRADHAVNTLRAALIKGCLNRLARACQRSEEEYPMSLDTNRQDAPYRLGRLFAVLEKAQSDALGPVNAPIGDRYFGSASAHPAGVFPVLIRLNRHHLQKLRKGDGQGGLAIVHERRLGEIMEGLGAFPAHLSLEEQGGFILGYYHQRNDLYRRKETQHSEEA